MARRLVLTLPVLLAMAGCFWGGFESGGCGPPGSPGVLGRCEFHYDCIEEDWSCASHPEDDRITYPVAVGARFALSTSCEGEGGTLVDGVSEETMRREVVDDGWSSESVRFQPLVPGPHALLALTPTRAVGDLIHVWALEPDRIAFWIRDYVDDTYRPLTEPAAITPHNGIFVSFALLAGEQRLAGGGLSYAWTISDDTVVGIVEGPAGIWLEGLAAGSATVGVDVAGMTASFEVVVTEVP
jgi:hypothetical protein